MVGRYVGSKLLFYARGERMLTTYLRMRHDFPQGLLFRTTTFTLYSLRGGGLSCGPYYSKFILMCLMLVTIFCGLSWAERARVDSFWNITYIAIIT